MDYKDITIKEIEYEKKLLKQYEIKLKRLPTGKLVCLRKKEKEEYYYIDAKDKKRKYINKENVIALIIHKSLKYFFCMGHPYLSSVK